MKKTFYFFSFLILSFLHYTTFSFFSPSEYYISPIKEDNVKKYLIEYQDEYFWKDKTIKDYTGVLRDSIIENILEEIDSTTIYINTLKYKIKLTKDAKLKQSLIQTNNLTVDKLTALYKLLWEKEGLCFDEKDKACLYTERYLKRNKQEDSIKKRDEWNSEIKSLFLKEWTIYSLYVKNQDKFILNSNKEVDLWDLDSELDGFVSSIKSVSANLKYSDTEKQKQYNYYKDLYLKELKPAIKENKYTDFSKFLEQEISYIINNNSNSKLLKKDYYYLNSSVRSNLTKNILKQPLETRTLYIWKLLTQTNNLIVKEKKVENRKLYRELKKFLQSELTKTLETLGKL